MKATGVTRKIDELGRIVLPIEFREKLGIEPKDTIEISLEGNRIVLTRHEEACVLCGGKQELVRYRDKLICRNCRLDLSYTQDY